MAERAEQSQAKPSENLNHRAAEDDASARLYSNVHGLLNSPDSIYQRGERTSKNDSPAVGGKFENYLRPLGAQDERERLTDSDKVVLDKLENAFLNADVKTLSKLVEDANPNKNGNLAARQNFQHAFNVFQMETGSLGFEAGYDSKNGILKLNNLKTDEGNASLRTLQIDPNRNVVLASMRDPRKLENSSLFYDLNSEQCTERSTRWQPSFRQETNQITGETAERKYFNLMSDQLAARKEQIEHQLLDDSLAYQKERAEKAESELQARGSEQRLREQEESWKRLAKEHRERSKAHTLPNLSIE